MFEDDDDDFVVARYTNGGGLYYSSSEMLRSKGGQEQLKALGELQAAQEKENRQSNTTVSVNISYTNVLEP